MKSSRLVDNEKKDEKQKKLISTFLFTTLRIPKQNKQKLYEVSRKIIQLFPWSVNQRKRVIYLKGSLSYLHLFYVSLIWIKKIAISKIHNASFKIAKQCRKSHKNIICFSFWTSMPILVTKFERNNIISNLKKLRHKLTKNIIERPSSNFNYQIDLADH